MSKDYYIYYEIYLSNDGIDWGTMEAAGTFGWVDQNDVSIKEIYFGAVTARYVQVIYLTNTQSDDNVHTGELIIYENDGAATGQQNQIITFDEIPDKGTEADPFDVIAPAFSPIFRNAVRSGL